MEQLLTETVAAKRTGTIIQHVQTDYFSLILRELDSGILMVVWDEVMENYQIHLSEIQYLRKAIQNYALKHGTVLLLVKTFDGIIVGPEIQKKLQNKEVYGGIRAVAIELQSTTHRISLNLSSQFSKNRIPIRAFASQESAFKWLKKKQSQKS